MRRLAVETEPGATCGDLKRSLEAMTRVPAARQRLAMEPKEGGGDAEILDDAAPAPAPAEWKRFDDAFVRPIAPDAPDATTKGYLFFYVHESLLC